MTRRQVIAGVFATSIIVAFFATRTFVGRSDQQAYDAPASPRSPGPPLRAGVGSPPPPPSVVSTVAARPQDEWQGMPVDLSTQAECEGATSCGLAMACLGPRCGPCARDSQCGDGEACVLQHCVRASLVACRSKRDCNQGYCILSGYSDGPRGNEDMRAFCSTDTPPATVEHAVPPEPGEPSGEKNVYDELSSQLD